MAREVERHEEIQSKLLESTRLELLGMVDDPQLLKVRLLADHFTREVRPLQKGSELKKSFKKSLKALKRHEKTLKRHEKKGIEAVPGVLRSPVEIWISSPQGGAFTVGSITHQEQETVEAQGSSAFTHHLTPL